MSKCWYCNEELTTANYCDEHIGICTKCYGSMFKVSNEFVKGLTDKIADLEAKLAEFEKFMKGNKFNDIQDVQNAINGIFQDTFDEKHKVWISICDRLAKCEQENKQLKQQLTEKEEIIDWQNEIVDGVKQEEELLAQKLKSLGVDCIEDLGKEHNQDKILFAIEKLEKVKEYIHGKYLDETWHNKIVDEDREDTHDYIDNQIKQLKEMKYEN